MPTNIQIRGVPKAVREEVRRRAKLAGKSMSAYVLDLIRRDLEFPPKEEWLALLRTQKPVKLPKPAAAYVMEARAERERELARAAKGKRRR